jgi:NAD(P)-dependent dehydrogenase (short-subunit alcohol dehydrogenase family)
MSFPAQQQTVPGTQAQMKPIPIPDCGENSYRGSGKLTGKKAIITGGDRGIGRAVAIAFAREGADVLVSYLNEDDDARDVARYVEDAGRPVRGGPLPRRGRPGGKGIRRHRHPRRQRRLPDDAQRPRRDPLIPSTMPPESVESFGDNVPLGRAGQPAELAPIYVLPASDDASYISGARVAVTGGRPIL